MAGTTQLALEVGLVGQAADGAALGGTCRLLRACQKSVRGVRGRGVVARPVRSPVNSADSRKETVTMGGYPPVVTATFPKSAEAPGDLRRLPTAHCIGRGGTGRGGRRAGAAQSHPDPVARGLMADGFMGWPGAGLGQSSPALDAFFNLPAAAEVGPQLRRKRQNEAACGRAPRAPWASGGAGRGSATLPQLPVTLATAVSGGAGRLKATGGSGNLWRRAFPPF